MWILVLNMNSFSFDSILTGYLFESFKYVFLEYEIFVPITANLDQTLKHANFKRLVGLKTH